MVHVKMFPHNTWFQKMYPQPLIPQEQEEMSEAQLFMRGCSWSNKKVPDLRDVPHWRNYSLFLEMCSWHLFPDHWPPFPINLDHSCPLLTIKLATVGETHWIDQLWQAQILELDAVDIGWIYLSLNWNYAGRLFSLHCWFLYSSSYPVKVLFVLFS